MQTEIRSSSLTVKINYFGAEVCSVKNNAGLEFIWQANKGVWARHAPVLFPIVGKLKDNFFTYKGNKFELPQHGFARDTLFELVEQKENACTFQLVSNNNTITNFPFDFVFRVSYQVTEDKLITNYTVLNPSKDSVYFSVGAHPGFNCPLLVNETFEDYYLEFEENVFSLTQLNNGLRTDAKKPLTLHNNNLALTKALFENDALVFENGQVNKISLRSTRSKHKITLLCEGWPYFGIWTKKGSTQFICLEPWYGIADHENTKNDLVKKDGIIKLAPGKEFHAQFSLIFS